MNALTFLKWYGIAIIAWMAFSVASGAVKAMRAGRFGIKHINLKFVLRAIIALIMFVTFFYGWFQFPDAPLHQCSGPSGYCGKEGQSHSLADYQAFELWQTTIFILWPIGMLASFLLQRKSTVPDSN